MVSALEGIFQFSIENKVVDVGLRLAIAQEVPDELEIRVDNVTENSVMVYLKGNETAVKKFYDCLKTKKLGKADKYNFSELKPLEIPGCFNIRSDRFYHKLQCEQMGKFVDAAIDMKGEMHNMGTEMHGMGTEMRDMRTEMRDGFGGLTAELKNLNQKLDDLPERIAEKLDDLPERIAQAIKETR